MRRRCPVSVEVLNGMTDLKEESAWKEQDKQRILIMVATSVLNSSVTIPGLKTGWDFGWRGATQLAPVEGWTQISALLHTPQDRSQKQWPMSVKVKLQREPHRPGEADTALSHRGIATGGSTVSIPVLMRGCYPKA